jgi:hypothetical protein
MVSREGHWKLLTLGEFGNRAEFWSKMPNDVFAAVALLDRDALLLDQCPAALVPVAVAVETALALVSFLR